MPNSTAGTQQHYGRAGDGEERELHVWGSIVSARISDIAEAIGATPEEVAQAAESEAVELLVDTSTNKAREDHDRPTSPGVRCVALTIDQLDALRNEVERAGARPHEMIG
jgi:hypothetical protein